ncbi:MAG: hypothetical protein GY851_03465 [bacterium]|nr:hypothetical protein [bacterium]
MILGIPVAVGQEVPHVVLAKMPTEPDIRLVILATPGTTGGRYAKGKLKGEIKSRRAILSFVQGSNSGPYYIMQDRDSMHLQQDNFIVMRDYMDAHPTCAVVALKRKRREGHPTLGCVMIRSEFTDPDLFAFEKADGCTCRTLKRQVEARGFSFGVIEDKVRVREIRC